MEFGLKEAIVLDFLSREIHFNMCCNLNYYKGYYWTEGNPLKLLPFIEKKIIDDLLEYDIIGCGQKNGKIYFTIYDSLLIDKYNLYKKPPETPPKKEIEKGFLYFIKIKDTDKYKIGITKSTKERISNIQTSNPFKIEIINTCKCEDYKNKEKFLHSKYSKKRIKNEWFELNKQDVKDIKQYMEENKL